MSQAKCVWNNIVLVKLKFQIETWNMINLQILHFYIVYKWLKFSNTNLGMLLKYVTVGFKFWNSIATALERYFMTFVLIYIFEM